MPVFLTIQWQCRAGGARLPAVGDGGRKAIRRAHRERSSGSVWATVPA